MTETIIWGVLWFFAISLSGLFVWVGALLGAWIAYALDADEWPLILGGIIGWVAGLAWGAFAVIQVVLHVVALIEILQ